MERKGLQLNRSSRTPLLIVFLTVFIDLLGFGIVLPLLPRYAKHFDADGLTLGLLMASFSLMQFLFAPLWGRLSDRTGRRPILMLGLAGSTLFYTMFGFTTSLGAGGLLLGLGVIPWLFICRIGAGIAGATIPTAQAYIADVTGPKERARGMALIGAAFGIGFTFGPLLGAAFIPGELGDADTLARPEVRARLQLSDNQERSILKQIDLSSGELRAGRTSLTRKQRDEIRTRRDDAIRGLLSADQYAGWLQLSAPSPAPGYLAGVLSGLALLSAIFLLPESLQTGASGAPVRARFNWASLHGALTHPQIGLILFTMFLTTFAFAQFESTLSLLTEFLGLSDRHNYFVFAYIGLILALSQGLLVRRLVPRWGEFVMSVVGTVLMTTGLLLVGAAGLSDSRAMLFAVLPLCVIGFSALNPSLQSLLSRQTAAEQQGGILGLGQSMAALARILGPLVGLPLTDWNMVYPYWTAAGLMAVGVVLALGLKTPAPDAAESPAA